MVSYSDRCRTAECCGTPYIAQPDTRFAEVMGLLGSWAVIGASVAGWSLPSLAAGIVRINLARACDHPPASVEGVPSDLMRV